MIPVVAHNVPTSPFKGLTPFEDSDLDAVLFFGREREREVIAANLLASRLTVLYGASGVGKSSVLRAGVAHHLRAMAKRNLETRGHPEFVVVVFGGWTEDPMAALLDAVQSELVDVFGPELAPASVPRRRPTRFMTGPTGSTATCSWCSIRPRSTSSTTSRRRAKGRWPESCRSSSRGRGCESASSLAIRDDALARLDRFKGHIPNLFANYLRLDHLDKRAGRAAILGPIEQYNALAQPEPRAAIEPELVEALLDETTTGRLSLGQRGRGVVRQSGARTRVEAPYLQLVLHRLWEEELAVGSSLMRLETLERLGGASEVVRTHLERALVGVPDRGQGRRRGRLQPPGHAVGDEDRARAPRSRAVRARRRGSARADRDARSCTSGSCGPSRSARTARSTGARTPRRTRSSTTSSARRCSTGGLDTSPSDGLRSSAPSRTAAIVGCWRILGVVIVALAAMTAIAAYAVAQRSEANKQASRATTRRCTQISSGSLQRNRRRKPRPLVRRPFARPKTLARPRRKRRPNARRPRSRGPPQWTGRTRRRRRRRGGESEGDRGRPTDEGRARGEPGGRGHGRRESSARTGLSERATAVRERRVAEARLFLVRRRRSSEGPDGDPAPRAQGGVVKALPEAEKVLRDGLLEQRMLAILAGGKGAVTAATFSPDGTRVATASESGEARVFRTSPVALLQRLPHGAPLTLDRVQPRRQPRRDRRRGRHRANLGSRAAATPPARPRTARSFGTMRESEPWSFHLTGGCPLPRATTAPFERGMSPAACN